MSSRGMPVTRQIRAERRARAEALQAEYDKLTLQQKIDRLPPEPQAAKQRARLLGLVAKQAEKVEADKLAAEAKQAAKEEKAAKKSKKD